MPGINPRPIVLAALCIGVFATYLGTVIGWRQAALMAVGVVAGIVLYHAAFGFTAAWRAMIVECRGAGLRAQMVMLAVTTAVFLPLLAEGDVFGVAVRGAVAPVGVSVAVGAFLFGIGMQLGGGCASGTLYTIGGGSVRMIATLVAFIAGSTLAAYHWAAWEAQPTLAPVSLLGSLGLAPALVLSLTLFAGVATVSVWLERRRHGQLTKPAVPATSHAWFRGPWPLIAGALGLAFVNIATLALAGRPWGVTAAFTLWGSKALETMGVDVAAWVFWQAPARAEQLGASIWSDVTSVMNIGIVLGALVAAGLAGRFAPTWRIPLSSLFAAIIGGLLLGYGARLAYGCNIGAFFSGVASSSFHGWLWFGAALVGNMIGANMRPLFGLR